VSASKYVFILPTMICQGISCVVHIACSRRIVQTVDAGLQTAPTARKVTRINWILTGLFLLSKEGEDVRWCNGSCWRI